MALLFIDGFDHYATADITKKWTAIGAGSPVINASAGRRSGGALLCPNATTNTANMQKTLPSSYATLIVGFALKVSAFSARSVVRLMDTATVHVNVFLNLDGTLSVRRGTTVLTTTASALSTDTWYYLELKATINDTTGSYDLRLNGSSWTSGSNVDTRNAGNASVNVVSLGTDGVATNALTQSFDDLYVADTSGSAPHNDFLGDVRIDTLYPTADGTYTQFTPSTGTDHYALVDETAPNTSDYVESSTAGHKDSYAMGDLSAITGTIFGVQVSAAALKDDAGARSLKVGVRSSTTDSVDAGTALSTSQLYYSRILQTDPATTAAWTESGVNAAQALVEVL